MLSHGHMGFADCCVHCYCLLGSLPFGMVVWRHCLPTTTGLTIYAVHNQSTSTWPLYTLRSLMIGPLGKLSDGNPAHLIAVVSFILSFTLY